MSFHLSLSSSLRLPFFRVNFSLGLGSLSRCRGHSSFLSCFFLPPRHLPFIPLSGLFFPRFFFSFRISSTIFLGSFPHPITLFFVSSIVGRRRLAHVPSCLRVVRRCWLNNRTFWFSLLPLYPSFVASFSFIAFLLLHYPPRPPSFLLSHTPSSISSCHFLLILRSTSFRTLH